MYSTDQFRVFPAAPVDRILSRPRRLLQEGRIEESEAAYAGLLATHPDLRQAWLEYFALLRHTRRLDEALSLSERAARQFGEDALPAALRGAALVELGRFREGLTALDEAARLDPDMGLVWHEAGYAAYRLGELSRALMALDRAFALEPHGGTLHLRGQVLRQAGRYLAAEVAFEGAAQAAEFPAQRQAAEREIRRTRRYAAFPGTRPETLPPNRRWFAESGAVPLTAGEGPGASDTEVLDAFVDLARDNEWRFTTLVAADRWEGWTELAARLEVPLVPRIPPEVEVIPLVAARSPATLPGWADLVQLPADVGRGLSFMIEQPVEALPADVVGSVPGGRGTVDLSLALEAARHPEGRLVGRVLR